MTFSPRSRTLRYVTLGDVPPPPGHRAGLRHIRRPRWTLTVALTMARARRVCPCVGCPAHRGGCPALTSGGRCVPCKREADLARGTRQQRGYDRQHDRLRAHWQTRLDRGEPIRCTSPTCLTPGLLIDPREWQLGHNDQRQHRGPEHPRCNLSAGGRAAHL